MKRILVGGLLGAIVMITWLFVVDGVLGFKRDIDMNQFAQERVVYAFLAEHVTKAGHYVCNPEVLPEQSYPGTAPVFAVHYSGLGHNDAGQEVVLGLVVALLASIGGAWLLGNASSRVLSRYSSRLFFFAMVGIVLALLSIASRFGIAAYSLKDAIALGLHDFAAWVVAGVAVAWLVRPPSEQRVTRAG